MITLRYSLLLFITISCTLLQAQSGALKGKVMDAETKEPIPFANVILELDGTQVGGASSDFDGNYMIKPIQPGTYDLKCTFVGYATVLVEGIIIKAEQIRFYDIEMKATAVTLDAVYCISYSKPLIDRDQVYRGNTVISGTASATSQSKPTTHDHLSEVTVTREEIAKLPQRSAGATAATVGGVYSYEGQAGNIRGARSDGTVTYIDGMRVVGSATLPQSAIEQVTIITGGTPAQYEGNVGIDSEIEIQSPGFLEGGGGAPPPPKVPPINIHTPMDIYYEDESYMTIEENEFVNPLNEPLSTLSIDVDRASYANVRRYLQRDQLPPADAIRLEEMINYFEYKYDGPTDDRPLNTHMELNECPWNTDHQLLLVGLQSKVLSTEDIPPSNLVFLIDVSGSMMDYNKLPLVQKSLNYLVDKLRPEDKVSIVVYAGAAGLVLDATSGDRKAKIRKAIDGLSAGGSTAGGAGIKLAYKIARDNFMEEGNNRVIMATDGDFNVGPFSDDDMVKLIEKKRETGIFLSVLGFGMGNYKDSKMERISNAGNGNYAYIDNLLEAQKVFGKELWGTLVTIAKDVKVQIEFNPALVKSYRLIGYENRLLNAEDFHNDLKDAGELGVGHTVTALYEIITPESEDSRHKIDESVFQKSVLVQREELCLLKIRYKDPDASESKLFEAFYKAEDIWREEVSTNFLLASSVAQFGLLLRDSEYKYDASYDNILAHKKALKELDDDEYVSEFLSLVKKAEMLTRDLP